MIIKRVLLFIIRSIVSFSFLFDFSFLCVCILFVRGVSLISLSLGRIRVYLIQNNFISLL